ncbi:rhomboid family intramembrane serine protease [Coralloluteibacterium thermophilus]|uniref:Rhomboid family intramembrane serine protease n=1 Tax=Coralloluteibacterium thermophilum TaxID=2707049 RepID=A0ABV9NLF8_9GAMM
MDPFRAQPDPAQVAAADRRRFRRAALASLGFVVLVWLVHLLGGGALGAFAVHPRSLSGLVGILTAPLLHGSWTHLIANTPSLLVLGTLMLAAYPRTARRALPLIWLGSGLGVWLIGRDAGHLGASGLTHGLLWCVFFLGLLRRDRSAIAATLIGFLLYGGMLLTVLPQGPEISWESHLCGALMGLLAAVLWRRLDPAPPRPRYSWEDEEEAEDAPPATTAHLPDRAPPG